MIIAPPIAAKDIICHQYLWNAISPPASSTSSTQLCAFFLSILAVFCGSSPCSSQLSSSSSSRSSPSAANGLLSCTSVSSDAAYRLALSTYASMLRLLIVLLLRVQV